MAEAHSNNYTLGRGRLYFDRFAPGTKTPTGERYIGNTPELSSSTSVSNLDHYSSDQGLKVKDESIMLSNDLSISFKTDDISPENLALLFLGEVLNATITAATAVAEIFTVNQGLSYQLGVSSVTPQGTRGVTNVTVEIQVPGSPPTYTVVAATGNYDVDTDRARVYIEPGAPGIPPGSIIRIKHDQVAGSQQTILGEGNVIAGALRYESANPQGDQNDYFWPYVKLSPNGDFALKGDNWQEIAFKGEVLIRDSSTLRVYISKPFVAP